MQLTKKAYFLITIPNKQYHTFPCLKNQFETQNIFAKYIKTDTNLTVAKKPECRRKVYVQNDFRPQPNSVAATKS
jgi:hypothetical protein